MHSLSFDKYILSCTHHHKQDTEHFYNSEKFFGSWVLFTCLFKAFTGVGLPAGAEERVVVFFFPKMYIIVLPGSPANTDNNVETHTSLTVGDGSRWKGI